MILRKYLHARILIIISIFTIIPALYLFLGGDQVTPQGGETPKKRFHHALKKYCQSEKITLHDLIYPDFNYVLFQYQPFWLIGEQNGTRDLFHGEIRLSKQGDIINIKEFKKITNTPLADEYHLKQFGKYILYKSSYNRRESIHVISKQKIYHLTMKHPGRVTVEIKDRKLFLNRMPFNFPIFQENPYFYFYESTLTPATPPSLLSNYLLPKNNQLITNILKQFEQSPLKEKQYPKIDRQYILTGNTLKRGALSINYLKLKLPNKPPVESYIFNKKNYFFNIATSGSYHLSRTGQVVNRLTTIHNAFSFDFTVKGGLKMDEIILRPLIINMPTLLINGKNHLIYGPGTAEKHPDRDQHPGDDYLQSPFPLIDHKKQSVLIENLKKNIQKEAEQDRSRNGLCFKGEEIFFFWGKLSRGALMDYMYLLKCDYAFETDSTRFTYNRPMVPGRVNILLTNKKTVPDQLNFKEQNGIFQYQTEGITIYRIPCNLLNLDYLPGRTDPVSNNLIKLDRELVVDDSIKHTLLSGSPDPIYPDGLFFERKHYYKQQKNRVAFYLKRDRCNIGLDFRVTDEDLNFFKEGKLIYQNQRKIPPKKERYRNARLGVGVKSDMVYLFQIQQPGQIARIIDLMAQLKLEAGLLFENSVSDGNPLTGAKLILKIQQDQREIYPLKHH